MCSFINMQDPNYDFNGTEALEPVLTHVFFKMQLSGLEIVTYCS